MHQRTKNKILGSFERRWICQVLRSGYHNGATCNPSDPHGNDWGCSYRYEASLNEATYERFLKVLDED